MRNFDEQRMNDASRLTTPAELNLFTTLSVVNVATDAILGSSMIR
jgi:hypothetical protein